MTEEKNITVYGASSTTLDEAFYEAARIVGESIAQSGATLVNGGGAAGLMGATIDGALAAGGKAIGVIPSFMSERGWGHTRLTQTIVTNGMHERKKLMADMAAGVIALPGGVGTLDELMEIITWRQLGLFTGQVVILNTLGYYEPLLKMLGDAQRMGFMRKGVERQLFQLTDSPRHAVKLALGQP